jgi:hypothetical protein
METRKATFQLPTDTAEDCDFLHYVKLDVFIGVITKAAVWEGLQWRHITGDRAFSYNKTN